MQCVICKHGETAPGQVTVTLQRGHTVVIMRDVPAEVCRNCGEYYLDEVVAAKEVQLSSMRGYLTENSPDFRQAQQELAALRAQLAKADQSRPTGGNAEYVNRYRDFKYNEELFGQLAKAIRTGQDRRIARGRSDPGGGWCLAACRT